MEVQQILSRYRDELPNPNGVLLDNAVSETKRVALSTVETILDAESFDTRRNLV
jgi:hypothetical protein